MSYDEQSPSEEKPLINVDFRHSWFTISNPAVILETVKKSEAGVNQIVLRLFEAYGSHCTTELKTSLPVASAQFCNALEETTESDAMEFKDQSITLAFKPFEIVTIMASL